jgi:hypothetical protein
MFDRVWRRTRDTYYTAGYHGVDWVALRPQYEKYLPHIGNSYEFAEMLSEMLGELNVSHSGARLLVLDADGRRDGVARHLHRLRPHRRGCAHRRGHARRPAGQGRDERAARHHHRGHRRRGHRAGHGLCAAAEPEGGKNVLLTLRERARHA